MGIKFRTSQIFTLLRSLSSSDQLNSAHDFNFSNYRDCKRKRITLVLSSGLQIQEGHQERNETLTFPMYLLHKLTTCLCFEPFPHLPGVLTIAAHHTKQKSTGPEVQLPKQLFYQFPKKVRVGCRCRGPRAGYQTQYYLFLSLIKSL